MLCERTKCTGCGACATGCPQKCIEMQPDAEGFRYPEIDHKRCISCRKCEKVCPVLNGEIPQADPRAFAARNKVDDIRMQSSSGGVFPALAGWVIDQGGAVCGAAYMDDFRVEHILIEDRSEIGKLQGAKYAQSKTEHLFEKIRRMLDMGKLVLFSGTSCQVAGLVFCLGGTYENLLTVDMICHGVPSPMVWYKYLAFRRAKDAGNAEITSINQRDKQSGWSRYRYSIHITYENGKSYYSPQSNDPFMRGFVNNLYLRPSCAQCQFKGIQRQADITLGDYWGVWDQYPEFDDNKGISVVFVHTEKGHNLWQKMGGSMDALPICIQDAVVQNPSAVKSSRSHRNREYFFRIVEGKPFDECVSHLLAAQISERKSIKSFLKKALGFRG